MINIAISFERYKWSGDALLGRAGTLQHHGDDRGRRDARAAAAPSVAAKSPAIHVDRSSHAHTMLQMRFAGQAAQRSTGLLVSDRASNPWSAQDAYGFEATTTSDGIPYATTTR